MRALDRTGTMPAPHEAIKLRVVVWETEGLHAHYTGTPTQLLAAGVVTPYMEQKILHQRSGAQLDAEGLRFSLERDQRKYRDKRVLWESGDLVTVLRKSRLPLDSGMALPGVRELYPEGVQEAWDSDVRENPGPGDLVCGSLNARACVHAETTGGEIVTRSRAVGRFQRLVRWGVVDGILIVPNWAQLVRDRLARAQGAEA